MNNETVQYEKYLASIMECQEKQDSSIQHEWLMDSRADAVRLSNYLRGHGYEVSNEIRKPLGIVMYYVGVPFSSLKTDSQ